MIAEQTWDPERYARNARFVSDLGAEIVGWLAPKAGERILDLGCGDGVLTAKLGAMGCDVVGVDGSRAQVEAARKLGIDARLMEGEKLTFDSEFDAVFSNAALHWMRNPKAVTRGVYRALRTKGRFVAELGGYGCVAKIKKALVEALNRRGLDGEAAIPWYFPTAEEYSALLNEAGFSVERIVLVPRPTPLPGDVTGWLETFAGSFIARLQDAERAEYIAEVREVLRSELVDGSGLWIADYVRLRFAASK